MIFSALLLLTSVCGSYELLPKNIIWPKNRIGREQNLTQVKVHLILPVNHKTVKTIPPGTVLLPALYKSGPGVLSGLNEADRRGIIDNVYFNISVQDSHCDNIYAPNAWTNAVVDKVNVLFGPSCDYSLAAVARQLKFKNVTLMTAGGMAYDFSRKRTEFEDEFYLLTKTGYNFRDPAKLIKEMMMEMNWQKLVIIYRKYDRGDWSGELTCSNMMSAVVEQMKLGEVALQEIRLDMTDKKFNNSADMLRNWLPELNYSISIICAQPSSVREIMLGAEEAGVLGSGQYVFFSTDIYSGYPKDYRPWYDPEASQSENERAKRAFSSLLSVTSVLDRSPMWQTFKNETIQIAEDVFNFTGYDDDNSFSANLHDAALLYAQALNESIVANGFASIKDGRNITRRMQNRTIMGITGPVIMDGNGDRGAEYSILQLDVSDWIYKPLRTFNTSESGVRGYYVERPFVWVGPGGGGIPLDYPPCGFQGICQLESDSSQIWSILLVVTSTLLVACCVLGFFIYRHYKSEAEIASMHWKISPDSIIPTKENRGKFGSKSSLYRSVTVSLDSLDVEGSKRQTFVRTVFYKGNVVTYKHLYTKHVNTQSRSLMLELKRLKDLQHDNLVRFLGASLEPDSSFVLTEYCPRGSLQDILEDGMEIDWDFKFSLIYDVVKGMMFLHASDLRLHGNLKSSNCVVDSRFAVKLTDFGLHSLRTEEDLDRKDCDNEFWKRMLWTAPELIHQQQNMPGTAEGDVYSFSIILHEIVVQQGAWAINFNCWAPQYIIQNIQTEYLRPPAPSDFEIDGELLDLMEHCWAQSPEQRPNFNDIKRDVRKINSTSTSNNIMDNLLSRMERYANNLESLVEERTEDYLEEKRKCENLLYQLLPQSIATSLINGTRVEAECFKSVTIYFSDIVGFTRLSSASTPIQVVNLLNDLYTCFDSIIGNFDVYKVETIGDAYMVVSGLPRINEHHAQEIARMSLSILKSVATFKIRHMKDEQLKLRIGIHTGPCCAGVVGIKMPRYCLFGDTVNTASRMESTGLPLKIHISERTHERLGSSFVTDLRGETEIKGKGKMNTFWLLREDKSLIGALTETKSAFESGEKLASSFDHVSNNNSKLLTIPLLSSVQLTEGSEYKNIAKPNSAFNAELSSSNHVTSDTQLTGDHEANVHSTLLPSSNLEVNSDKQSKKRKSVNFNTVS